MTNRKMRYRRRLTPRFYPQLIEQSWSAMRD
jgi:hypothetical protein